MAESTTEVFASVRPSLLIEGEVDEQISSSLVDLTARHRLGAPAQLKFDLVPPRSETSDAIRVFVSKRLPLGTGIAVGVGEQQENIFSGHVAAIDEHWGERGVSLRITATDPLDKWQFGRHTRVFENMSVSDVINELATRHSLAVQITAAASDMRRPWTQFNQDDLSFLLQVAAHIGADVFLDHDKLLVQTPDFADNSAVTLRYGQNLKSFHVKTDLTEQLTRVAMQGWDPAIKSAISRETAFPEGELRPCVSGPRMLTNNDVHDAAVHLSNIAYSHPQADVLTRAVYGDHAHRFVTTRGVTRGEPGLVVGEWVRIAGIDERLDVSYYVREVRHRFTQAIGFETDFAAETACAGEQEERANASDDQRASGERESGGQSERKRRSDPLERLRELFGARRRRRARRETDGRSG